MAIPKTPRKRADKPDGGKPADAAKAVIDPAAPKISSDTGEYVVVPAAQRPAQEPGLKLDKAAEAASAASAPDALLDKAVETAVEQAVVPGDSSIQPAPDLSTPDLPTPDLPTNAEPGSGRPPQEPAKQAKRPQADAPAALPSSAPSVIKSGPGFVPLVLGGVVAAGLGFGLARYVVPEGWPVPGATPLQAQLSQQGDEIAALRAEILALPKENDTAALQDALASVQAAAATALETAEAAKLAAANIPDAVANQDLTPRLAALEDRVAAVEAQPSAGAAVDPAVITRLNAEIDALRAGLEAQKIASENLVFKAEAVRADAVEQAESVLLQAALTKVEAAMQNGATFAEPLAMLANAGVVVPAVLTQTAESGVPTIAALTQEFDAPARIALQKGLRGNMGSTWSDRFGSFLRSQTGARSLTPKEGDDPDAVLSRANAAVAKGDLQTALTEIATLPETAQAALSAWGEQAKLRLDAQAATVELATALSER